MKTRLVYIFTIMFFALGIFAYAEGLTADDLVAKIKTIVDTDFEQEDQLKPIMDDYASDINKINVLIQKGVDKGVIVQKLLKLDNDLDMKLKDVFTADQLHQWDVEKNAFYKEILTTDNNQNQ